jgi:hypothetical protein
MNLVADWNETSAPRSSGRWFTDVANVLSTASSEEGFRVAEQMVRTSATVKSGFDGDSSQTRSASEHARTHAPVSSTASLTRDQTPLRFPASARPTTP